VELNQPFKVRAAKRPKRLKLVAVFTPVVALLWVVYAHFYPPRSGVPNDIVTTSDNGSTILTGPHAKVSVPVTTTVTANGSGAVAVSNSAGATVRVGR